MHVSAILIDKFRNMSRYGIQSKHSKYIFATIIEVALVALIRLYKKFDAIIIVKTTVIYLFESYFF